MAFPKQKKKKEKRKASGQAPFWFFVGAIVHENVPPWLPLLEYWTSDRLFLLFRANTAEQTHRGMGVGGEREGNVKGIWDVIDGINGDPLTGYCCGWLAVFIGDDVCSI